MSNSNNYDRRKSDFHDRDETTERERERRKLNGNNVEMDDSNGEDSQYCKDGEDNVTFIRSTATICEQQQQLLH